MKLLLKQIEGTKHMQNVYIVTTEKEVYIGHFAKLEDDFYYYWPNDVDHKGYFGEQELRLVAEKLQELNKEMNDKINKYFKQ